MKTKISDRGEYMVVEISGYLNFETANPVAQQIERLYANDPQSKVVIDLSGLEFVGSSGISNFVKSLRVFNRSRVKPAYFGVKSEFVRLFRAFEEGSPFDIWNDLEEAKDSALKRYQEWEIRTPRSKRTH